MHIAAVVKDKGVRRVLVAQALITVAAAGGFAAARGRLAALSALYGGTVTLISTGWMARRVWRAGGYAVRDLGHGALALYGGLVLKYLLVIASLAAGLGVLGLAPLPLLVGFAAAQAGFVIAAGWPART